MSNLALAQSTVRSFCTFRAQDRLYGIEVAQVREVSTHVATTPVPQAPPLVRGLANLRSRIYLVLDLSPALGLPAPECTTDSRLIVLHPRVAEGLGLFVDCGGDIVRVSLEQMEEIARPAAGNAEALVAQPASPVVGVCKLDTELMMIIDPKRLVGALEQEIHLHALTGKTLRQQRHNFLGATGVQGIHKQGQVQGLHPGVFENQF